MKKYVRPLWEFKITRKIRNLIVFKDNFRRWPLERNYLASDLFIWRTDNGLSTVFKSNNILFDYYSVDSYLKIVFYNKNGKYIRELDVDFVEGLGEILIHKELLGCEDYGTFCVFNMPSGELKQEVKIINRCYVGYGRGKCLSMMHGNLVAVMVNPKVPGERVVKNIKSAVFSRKTEKKYSIQSPFYSGFTHSLLFSNPSDIAILVNVNGISYQIESRGCNIVTPKFEGDCGKVEIVSDFFYPRPLVITENEKFVDCYHA